MIEWNVEKLLLVKDETQVNWKTLDNILGVTGLSVIINRAKNMPESYSFPGRQRNARLTNENLTDTLIPMITSFGEWSRDNGNKKFYNRMQVLLKELED